MSRGMGGISPQKALLIICEGRNTEPNFFSNFSSTWDGFIIKTFPKPRMSKVDVTMHSSRGGKKRIKRSIQRTGKEPDIEPTINVIGPPPLSWVEAAEKQFNTYEEIWCVYDKDGHPKRKEAFEKADSLRLQGYNINIAFSSICIEYYFLLHFEYKYYAFNKSECKIPKKGKPANCMLPDAVAPFACLGDRCVNGYARLNGYWADSKSDENEIFPLLKNRLFAGIRNAVLLRRESDLKESELPFYDRNPYTDVDLLIARLIGYRILGSDESYSFKEDATNLIVKKEGSIITICNEGPIAYSMRQDFISVFYYQNGEVGNGIVDSCVIEPGKALPIKLGAKEGDTFLIKTSRIKILVVI